MFPGSSRKRDNCRVIPLASVARIALNGDDPDFIILEAVNVNFTDSTVTVPNTAPIGKSFTFMLTANPQTLPALTTHRVVINVPVNRKGSTTIIPFYLHAGQEARFLYARNGWHTPRGMFIGSDGANSSGGIALGDQANGASLGVGIGMNAQAATTGVAVGYGAVGTSTGVGLGALAVAATNGVAVGYTASTNGMDKAVALGYFSKAQRYRELVKSADGATTCLQSFSILDWYKDTTDATPVEILLGGTAAQYALLLNNSAFAFKLMAAARNNVDDVCKFWEITGGIKRGAAAANTALVGTITKTVIAADAGAATWDMDAVADTSNGSLKLNVTGEAAKTIRWNVRGDISELRF